MSEQLWRTTLGGLLKDRAEKYPTLQAIKYTDRDYTRSWREFDEQTDRVARGLMALGVRKGDHVAIWAPNIPEWLLTLFATAKAGGVLVTVNTNYKVFELEYLLKQSDSRVLVMAPSYKSTDYSQIINELLPDLAGADPGQELDFPELPRLKRIVYTGTTPPAGTIPFSGLEKLGESVSEDELRARSADIGPDDVVNMQYTSGTTGFPKGVMLTHCNVINNGRSIGDCMEFSPADRLCVPVPFFHCFGLVLATMACVTHATGMVPVDVYEPKKVMDAIESEKCTAVHGVPTMFIAMLEHPEFDSHDFSSLRTGIMAGSPCPIEVMRRVVERMNMTGITIAYGQTEASPVCTQTTTDDSLELRVRTVGRVLPGVEAKVVDMATGEALPPDTDGEFCARGYNIMKGYYKMPEATALAIDADGWLHSGDIARVDKNGYYTITGRIKDMIIRGGENIYPKEIEEFLYTYDKVQDVQVIGVPSEKFGEEIMACIVPKAGVDVTEQEIKDYVSSHMARYKTPRYVRFVEGFPQNAAGKILKYKMREQYANELHASSAHLNA